MSKPILWMYWEEPPDRDTPPYFYLCRQSIEDNNPEFDIRIVTPDNLHDYLPQIQLSPKLACIAHRADYIRMHLLYEYGGMWLDSDVICRRSLIEIMDKLLEYEFVGCRRNRDGFNHVPIWFLAAQKGSIIIKRHLEMVEDILSTTQELAWTQIGHDVLTQAVDENPSKCYLYPEQVFSPIPYNRWQDFFSTEVLVEDVMQDDPYTIVLWNQMFPTDFRYMSSQEVLKLGWLLSRIFRKVLSKNKPVVVFMAALELDNQFYRALGSCWEQETPVRVHVVCSGDRGDLSHPRVTVVYTPKEGLAAARNAGFRTCPVYYEYATFLDSDDVLDVQATSVALSIFKTGYNGLVYGDFNFNGSLVAAPTEFNMLPWLVEQNIAISGLFFPRHLSDLEWDESFPVCEDLDWKYRALKRTGSSRHAGRKMVDINWDQTSMSADYHAMNRYYVKFLVKHNLSIELALARIHRDLRSGTYQKRGNVDGFVGILDGYREWWWPTQDL